MATTSSTSSKSQERRRRVQQQPEGDEFPTLAREVRRSAALAKPPFFTVDAGDLYKTYLAGFRLRSERQHHDCNACRRFIERYGSLVTISDSGSTRSVMWQESAAIPEVYRQSVTAMRLAVEKAPVDGVFLSTEASWGTYKTHDEKRGIDWTHFEVDSPARFKHAILTAGQAMAEKREEHGMLARALEEFDRGTCAVARNLLQGEQLYRGEKVLGVATWLVELHEALDSAGVKRRDGKYDKRHRNNLVWRAAASAPPGFCHVRSTMIGTLLDDLKLITPRSGFTVEDAKRRFAEKMHPLQYQRPTAPPTAGNIAQAEVIFEKMRTAGALERRFARLEDITRRIWVRRDVPPVPAPAPGLFSHLKPGVKHGDVVDVGAAMPITWEKFRRTVLTDSRPDAIDFLAPPHGDFIALVTAARADAAPIIQWDGDHLNRPRNPVSWYLYDGGSGAYRWNVTPGWVRVNMITLLPPLWNDETITNHGEGVILILDGCRDTQHQRSGGLFVENLKSEYHSVRRTLEAHLMQAPIADKHLATACGYDLRKGSRLWNARVRVTAGNVRTTYVIDRWD